MIKLNINEEKSLQFEVNIQGIDYSKLNGSIRVVVENVEYGFPIEISENEISTTLPPLKDIIKHGLVNEAMIKTKLEIFGEGFYLSPWQEEIKIEVPVLVEAKVISEKTNKKNKSINVNLISEKSKCKKEEINDDFNIDSVDSFNPKKEKLEDIQIVSKDEMNHDLNNDQIDNPELIHTLAKARTKAKIKTMTNVVDKLLKDRGVSQVYKEKKNIQKENKKINKPKTITEDSIFNLMESRGLKNKKIQKLLLISANEKSLGDLNETYNFINKMLTKKRNPIKS